jgi:hypothetical protein
LRLKPMKRLPIATKLSYQKCCKSTKRQKLKNLANTQ